MSKKYKIEYLPIAQDDLIDIFDYIKEDNPDAAANFIKRIDKAVSKLDLFPLLGTIIFIFIVNSLQRIQACYLYFEVVT